MPIFKDGEAQVAEFGAGDILISKAGDRGAPFQDQIVLIPVPENHQVNSFVDPDYSARFAGRDARE